MKSGPFEILWTEIAESDLSEIIEYITGDSLSRAPKILTAIKNKTTRLNNSPERGRIVPEFQKFNINSLRELVVSHWRVIFRIEGNTVYILAVIDGRRNVEDILLARFLREN